MVLTVPRNVNAMKNCQQVVTQKQESVTVTQATGERFAETNVLGTSMAKSARVVVSVQLTHGVTTSLENVRGIVLLVVQE